MRKKTICLIIIITLALSIFPLVPRTTAQTEPTISLTPSTTQVTQLDQTFTLGITISNVQNLWLWDAVIIWDPAVLTMVNTPQEGDFMPQAGSTLFIAIPPNNGTVPDITDTLISTSGVSGSGVLATLEFKVIAQSASTTVQVANITLQAPLPAGEETGTAHPAITPTSTSSTATVSFVQGGAPAANAGPDQTVTEGTTVTFDGSKSISAGTNPTYAWSFTYNGATQALSGVTPTFPFSIPGIYVVTLTLTDSNGADTSTVTITVQSNTKPVAVIVIEGISQGQSATVGQTITFNGTESYEANNGTIARYLWNTGDASGGTTATITHAYAVPGTFNVTLTVFDATNLNDTTSTLLTVVKGTGQTSSPTPTTSTPTSTPSPNSSSTPTPTPTPNSTPQASLPPDILAIIVIITILVLGGSTLWLRKRT